MVDRFTIHGDVYARQRAAFPIDVIIAYGVGTSSRPKPHQLKQGGLPEVFCDWEKLKDEKLIRPTRETEASNDPESGSEDSDQDLHTDGQPASGDTGSGESTDNQLGNVQGGNATKSPGNVSGRQGSGGRSGGNASGTRSGRGSGRGSGRDGGVSGGNTQGGTNAGGRSGADQSGGVRGPRSGDESTDVSGQSSELKPQQKTFSQDAENESQAAYPRMSSSYGVGTLVPRTQLESIQRAMEDAQEKYGDFDDLVATDLGYNRDEMLSAGLFSAEQIDAVGRPSWHRINLSLMFMSGQDT